MRKIFCSLFFGVLAILGATSLHAQQGIDYTLCSMDFRAIGMHDGLPSGAIYADTKASAEDRAHDLVSRMTFDEKLMLTGGFKQFYLPGVPRLGVPPVYFADATQGIHEKDICTRVLKTTAFPSGLALAATWDTALAYQYAHAISEECRAWGIGALLGPGLNLYRNSEGGRNFEYFGEDPFLTSSLGVSYVKGMQSLGTVATIKHFLGNEQEFIRHDADVRIGERALHELYLAPFRAAIEEGGALAVMDGNNFVNGYPGAADTPLAQGVLRDRYHFKGVMMSDWANSMYWPDRHSEELVSGNSLLMENNALFAKYVQDRIAADPSQKPVIEAQLGKMAFANLYSFFKSGAYDRPYRDPSLVAKIESHQSIARQTAEEAITLLKNDGILPLDPSHVRKIAVVGSDSALSVYGGKGSGVVKGYDHVEFLAGLKSTFGEGVVRTGFDKPDEIRAAEVVLLFLEKRASEGMDFAYDQPGVGEAVQDYAHLNRNLVVIYSAGNGAPMPWLGSARAVLFAYFLGQQRGTALAAVLGGAVNPSGKLPFTMETSFKDSPAFNYNKLPDGSAYYGGGRGNSRTIQDKFGILPIRYDEGVYMGYRWYEKKKIATQFPFGFGLSYTTFQYSPLKLSSASLRGDQVLRVTFNLTNNGSCDGSEVIQMYVQDLAPRVDRPVKELEDFERVFLKRGETRSIILTLKPQKLAFWNDQTHDWQINPGRYQVQIAASSTDVRQHATFTYIASKSGVENRSHGK